jgi:hypothetical protein
MPRPFDRFGFIRSSGAPAITAVTEIQRGNVTSSGTQTSPSMNATGGGLLLCFMNAQPGDPGVNLGGTLSANWSQVRSFSNPGSGEIIKLYKATTYNTSGTIQTSIAGSNGIFWSVVEVLGGTQTIVQSKTATDGVGNATQTITMDAAITTGTYSVFWCTCSNNLRTVSTVNTAGYTHIHTAPIFISFLKKTPAGNTMSVTWDASVFGDEIGVELA